MIKLVYRLCTFTLAIILVSCDDFVQIDEPRTDLIRSTVFTSNETAQAAIADIYYQIGFAGYASGGLTSVSLLASLSADEMTNGITFDDSYQQINENDILPVNPRITILWQDMYACIYKCNAIIEGLAESTGIDSEIKNQIEGEARFFRAFTNFYLINLFGPVPLVLTTDYKTNQNLARTEMTVVYQQIVDDLLQAQEQLADGYPYTKGEKIRLNRSCATAFLARVSLYMKDWSAAEAYAASVIDSGGYSLESDLLQVFLKNNDEAIFQFFPPLGHPQDLLAHYSYGHRLSPSLIGAFESGDQRAVLWNKTERLHKYQSLTPNIEYSVVFRLAEQYLIRAEARANQDKLQDAVNDVNVIRTRAGLPEVSPADKDALLTAIYQERRVELFTEWGHRWFDLKRSGQLDTAMETIKAGWQTTDALYPIPEIQIKNSPAMANAQNPGY